MKEYELYQYTHSLEPALDNAPPSFFSKPWATFAFRFLYNPLFQRLLRDSLSFTKNAGNAQTPL
jgi:hypothetical protein